MLREFRLYRALQWDDLLKWFPMYIFLTIVTLWIPCESINNGYRCFHWILDGLNYVCCIKKENPCSSSADFTITVRLLFIRAVTSRVMCCGYPRGGRSTDALPPPTGVPSAVRGHTCIKRGKSVWQGGKATGRLQRSGVRKHLTAPIALLCLDTLIRKGWSHEFIKWLVVARLCAGRGVGNKD